jgi:hypothetical protein
LPDVLTADVALLDRHERDSHSDDGDRNGCGHPAADKWHCTTKHEDDRDRQ